MSKPKLLPCSDCGGMVPEFDSYPFPGHSKNCPDAKRWREEHERQLRPVYGGLNDAVDDCIRKDQEIKQLRAQLARARMNSSKLRQVCKSILASIGSLPLEMRGQINRVLRETGGRK